MKYIEHPQREIAYLKYVNRENDFRHTYYDEEMKQYRLMQSGDYSGVEESAGMMLRNQNTNLSVDPVRNIKYLFIACVTITTRFAIEGGLDSETAYNTSDLYIRKVDDLWTIDEVMRLHREMFTFFTKLMAELKKESVFSKPVLQCMDYIDTHLHMKISTSDLAGLVDLNRSYLSTLFKKETGNTIAEYILIRRIETAKQMLIYSEFSASQISEILSFSSQSHFIRHFRSFVGMTPREYVKLHFRDNLKAAIKA